MNKVKWTIRNESTGEIRDTSTTELALIRVEITTTNHL